MDVTLTPRKENGEPYLHPTSSSNSRSCSANARLSEFSSFSSPLQRFVEAKAKIQDIYRRIERCIDKIVVILSEGASTCSSVESSFLEHVESFKAGVSQISGMLARDHMKVVFFGRTSNGKSTVVNAMLHSKVLPYGMGHTTRCFLQVEGSSSDRRCLVKEGSDDNLSLDSIDKIAHAFCSQEMGEDVLFRVLWPKADSRLLQNEVVLVDSPGIDVTPQFDEWIDKHCLDADVFVLVCNAEATLTNSEKKFFERVNAKLSKPNVFILNNRWDVCMMESETVDKLRRQHTKRCLDFLVEELKVCNEAEAKNRIFFVSAREVLCRRLQRKGIASPNLMSATDGAEERLEEFENFERQFEVWVFSDSNDVALKLCISKSAILTKFDSHVEKGKAICDDIYETLNVVQKNVKLERERCVRSYTKKEAMVSESRSGLSEFLLNVKNTTLKLGDNVKEQISKEFNDQMIRLETFVEHYSEKFAADPCFLDSYRKELISQVDYVMNAELPERCSTRVLRQIMETERQLASVVAKLVPQEAHDKAEMMAQMRPTFEFTFTVPCMELLDDFQEDLDFRFSLGISTLLSKISKEKFLRYLSQGDNRSQAWSQTDNPSSRAVTFTGSPAVSSALVTSASLVADGGIGFLLVCTVVKRVVGWPVLVAIVAIYELFYLYERLCWNDRAKEQAFKHQFCDHLDYKVKLLESTIAETCKHQVTREIKELSSRLLEVANEELDTLQLEVEELKRECELLDEVSSVITPMRNNLAMLRGDLDNFKNNYLRPCL
uniref:Dynamin-type G domain-containing protein n=1 Tax=Trichuris muris TaxID=70415 RepID=A0A5S6QNA6_TRIMR